MSTTTRDRGAVLPIVALVLPVLMIMVAFAVDLGQQRSSRRTMQARADIIALDMARLADGRTLQEILDGDDTHEPAMVAMAASASRNDIPIAQLDTPEFGTWTEASGFVESTVPTFTPTAVHITARETTDYTFRPGSGNVERDAIAVRGAVPDDPDCDPATDPECPPPCEPDDTTCCPAGDPACAMEMLAGFSIGSFGASISAANAGILNQTITPILGHPLDVDALSYQGLAVTTVRIWDIGVELGLVTTDEVLNTSVAIDDLMMATAQVLRRSGDPTSVASATVLENMAATAETQLLPSITLGQIVTTGQGGEDYAAGSTVDVLSIVQAAAYLSQCDDPTDISTCSGINVPSLSTSLPLLDTTGTLRVIQGPASAYGPIGTSARNSQLSTTLGVQLGGQYVGNCVRTLLNLCLLQGLLVGTIDAQVTVNATVTLANGEGTISDITCGQPLGLDVLTTTGLYDVDLDILVEFGNRGTLGGLIGPKLGSLHLVGTTELIDTGQTIVFDVPPDVLNVTTKEAGAGTVGLSTVALTTPDGTGILGTLGSLGINMTTNQVVSALVNPLLVELDTDILGPLSDTLGVNVVGADITAQRIDCFETVVLVG